MKQQKPKPIIAVVAPSEGHDSVKQRPVVVLLNNPSILGSEEDDFDLSSLMGNFEPGDKNKVDYVQPDVKPHMSEDGFEGGVAQAQFDPAVQPGEEPDFIQPETAPVVIPGPILVEKQEEVKQAAADEEAIVVLAEEPVAVPPMAEDPVVPQPEEQPAQQVEKVDEPAKVEEPVVPAQEESVKV